MQKASVDARDAIRRFVRDQWRALARIASLPGRLPDVRRGLRLSVRGLALRLQELRLQVAFRCISFLAASPATAVPRTAR